MEPTIICNKAKCLNCGDTLISHHRHDYKSCSCNSLSVDGGNAYLSRGYNDLSQVEELSIYSDAPFEVIRENFYRGTRGKNFDQELTWIKLCDMSDEHLNNTIVYNDELGLSASANYWYCKEIKYRQQMGIKIYE